MKSVLNYKLKIWKPSFLAGIALLFWGSINAQFTVLAGLTGTNSPSFITVGGSSTTGLLLGTGSNTNNSLNDYRNIAIGSGAIANVLSISTTTSPNLGANNIGIGINALRNIQYDYNNIAIGNSALLNLQSGTYNNIAIGQGALTLATTGTNFSSAYSINNIAIGVSAMANSYNSTDLNTTNSQNIAIGYQALFVNRNQWNIGIGIQTLSANTIGYGNVCMGVTSALKNTSGSVNTALGHTCLNNNTTGSNNVAVGGSSLSSNVGGSYNTALGTSSLSNSTGDYNVGIGYHAQVTTGASYELNIQNGIFGKNMSGNTVCNVGIGAVPGATSVGGVNTLAKLEVAGTLKVDVIANVTNPTNRFLYWNSDGVVKESAIPSQGITNACIGAANINYVPRNVDASGNLTCSQIYDNGSGVGIGTNTGFTYTGGGQPFTQGSSLPTSFRLVVNGWISSAGMMAFSDQRLKSNIEKIETPIKKILKISGYTYNWNEKAKSMKQFDNNKQAGFLAQEIEKILPEAVIINEEGIYGLNYNAIMPLLTEGIKEQQTQIETQQLKIENLELQVTELRNKLNQLIPGDVKIKINSLEVAPNPVTGVSVVSYTLDNANTASFLVISDLQGRLLKKISLAKNQLQGQVQVNSKDLPNGMYVFAIVSGNAEVQSKKVLVAAAE